MKITKLEHACLEITEGQARVIIDPGVFSESLTNFSNIKAVVITHLHPDHFDPDLVQSIISANPNVQVFTTEETAAKIASNTKVVKAGQKFTVNNFSLEFYGQDHAEIDPKTAVVQNVGVLINDKIYYPGDSFTQCPKPFKILAAPASAPWLRVGKVMPLIENSNCNQVFPTHNALLSDIGHNITNDWLQQFAERSGKEFQYLKPGDSIEV